MNFLEHGAAPLVVVAVVIAFAGLLWAWISSAPHASAHGHVAELRRIVHARVGVGRILCRHCGARVAAAGRYCSSDCADRDGDLQAHG